MNDFMCVTNVYVPNGESLNYQSQEGNVASVSSQSLNRRVAIPEQEHVVSVFNVRTKQGPLVQKIKISAYCPLADINIIRNGIEWENDKLKLQVLELLEKYSSVLQVLREDCIGFKTIQTLLTYPTIDPLSFYLKNLSKFSDSDIKQEIIKTNKIIKNLSTEMFEYLCRYAEEIEIFMDFFPDISKCNAIERFFTIFGKEEFAKVKHNVFVEKIRYCQSKAITIDKNMFPSSDIMYDCFMEFYIDGFFEKYQHLFKHDILPPLEKMNSVLHDLKTKKITYKILYFLFLEESYRIDENKSPPETLGFLQVSNTEHRELKLETILSIFSKYPAFKNLCCEDGCRLTYYQIIDLLLHKDAVALLCLSIRDNTHLELIEFGEVAYQFFLKHAKFIFYYKVHTSILYPRNYLRNFIEGHNDHQLKQLSKRIDDWGMYSYYIQMSSDPDTLRNTIIKKIYFDIYKAGLNQ
ncbi:hypothetical protein [Endozoicomonas ascidiicola]|uniref:hypothetical protein n=1 Tax=Endozoicomonas ascidiicola TaxID=1698521 RepID=UPI00082DBB12|nr:hypothetical protein [Endozoicomonas ascidiicola]